MTPLPVSATAAFVALTVAIVALWAPQVSSASRAHQLWMVPGGLALVLASAGGLIELTAVVAFIIAGDRAAFQLFSTRLVFEGSVVAINALAGAYVGIRLRSADTVESASTR